MTFSLLKETMLMADEELHETTADDQNDLQSTNDTAAVEEGNKTVQDDADETTVESASADSNDADDLDIPMDRVEAVLNATADKDSLSPQMQRMMNRQAENTRRVEETIKGTKSNPRWFVPLFCALMIIGLVWAVVYYLTSDYPIPNIGAWNLAIAFAIIMVGFIMTMWWR
ncbi:cell division protein CrgA [Bifidobacterium catenulatum]|nr:cell division protein CrgA [Bifidobacterium catenulatum]